MCHHTCKEHLYKGVDDDLTTQNVSHCKVKKLENKPDQYKYQCDFCDNQAEYTTEQFYPVL